MSKRDQYRSGMPIHVSAAEDPPGGSPRGKSSDAPQSARNEERQRERRIAPAVALKLDRSVVVGVVHALPPTYYYFRRSRYT